jgi:hypothetical protein
MKLATLGGAAVLISAISAGIGLSSFPSRAAKADDSAKTSTADQASGDDKSAAERDRSERKSTDTPSQKSGDKNAKKSAESKPKSATVAPKAADADAPLPDGWPGATAPGTIEIKSYPAYRGAVSRNPKTVLGAENGMFFSLFNHIQKNEIAMTAPVVNTYDSVLIDDPGKPGSASMEFLYRTKDMGHTGKDGEYVEVIDHPAATYICLGHQGAMNTAQLREGVSKLRAWLAKHADEWIADGDPRRLGYHGPMTPTNRKLWEIQIPVRKVQKKDARPTKDNPPQNTKPPTGRSDDRSPETKTSKK